MSSSLGRLLLLAVVILAATLPAHAGTAVVLTLAEEAEAAGENILLGEIAEITISGAVAGGASPRAFDPAAAVADIIVGRAPKPGRSRWIDRSYVGLRMKQHGFQGDAVVLHGPERISVTRAAATMTAAAVEAMVREYLEDWIASSGEDAEIDEISGAKDVILPAGQVTRAVEIPGRGRRSGSLRVAVRFSVDGTPVRRIQVYARIRRRIAAVVAARPMARGGTITPADVALRKIDASAVAPNAFARVEDAVGKVARKSITVNTVLRPDMVQRPFLVERGDIVRIVARSARIRIVTLGEVRKKGRRDDRIRVLNLDSEEEVYARVIDGDTVAVNF